MTDLSTPEPVPVPTSTGPVSGRPLTGWQAWTLGAASAAMIAIGVLGAIGTYSNLTSVFPGPTALGAVAAGEGATMILALVYVGLTMLGQSSPATVRLGLWILPAIASGVGAVAATGTTATAIYAMTPLAMCTAAEGAGLLARRIVVRTTGVDAEARRRTADAVRRLAYERARAANHPSGWVKWVAERRAWRIARRVGLGDIGLGDDLVDVQRVRLTQAADAALSIMFVPAVTPPVTPALTAAPDPVAAHQDGTAVPDDGTQVSATAAPADGTPGTPPGTPPVTGVTLADLATVASVAEPTPGNPLDDEQLEVVLRWLRHHDDPPLSYRQARAIYREHGFVGSEERVRRSWGALLLAEEDGDQPPAGSPEL